MIPVPGGWPTIVTKGFWFIAKRRSFFMDRSVFVGGAIGFLWVRMREICGTIGYYFNGGKKILNCLF